MAFPISFFIGGKQVKYLSATNYTVTAGDNGAQIIVSGVTGGVTLVITLPSAVSMMGMVQFSVSVVNNSTGNVAVTCATGDVFDGGTTTVNMGRGCGALSVSPSTSVSVSGVTTARWAVFSGNPYISFSGSNTSSATAFGDSSFAIGPGASAASGGYSRCIAIGALATAGANATTAIGANSTNQGSVATTGTGAMALGGSYASGTDSFAAAIANNTSSYGATGANSVAMGQTAKASGGNAIAIGYASLASSTRSIVIGAAAAGISSTASGSDAVVIGGAGLAAQTGKYAMAGGAFAVTGDSQFGQLVIRAATTGTLVILTSDSAAASTANQLIVASNQVMTFTGTIIGKQTASANIAAYNISGTLVNNAGTVTMPTGTVTAIGVPTAGWTAPTLAADNTNKGLTVNSGFNAATNIRWVCYLQTAELTYA